MAKSLDLKSSIEIKKMIDEFRKMFKEYYNFDYDSYLKDKDPYLYRLHEYFDQFNYQKTNN